MAEQITIDTADEYARDFVRAHLQQMASELVEWDETSILPSGFVRQLALELQAVFPASQTLQITKSHVTYAALKAVAKGLDR